ncbi:MAG: hypothetical protein ACE5HS_07620 [bacterium]
MARIPESPEEIFKDFTEDVQNAFEKELVSIILYGSGAKHAYIPKKSDINFLIALTDRGIENLQNAINLVAKWRKRNVAVPLFLTQSYIDSALDTFPIEFLNLKSRYQVVFGDDLLSGVVIKKSDLRLQIERELRGKLIYLREGFLSTGQDRRALYEMLAATVPSFVSIFSALLYLKDEAVPDSRIKAFERTGELFGLQNAVFTHLLNIKRGEWRGSKTQLHEITMSFINQIKKLVEQVDKI